MTSTKMEKTMAAKMEEGFENKQLARQQEKNVIWQKRIRMHLLKMEGLQMGNGTTTCSEASVGVCLGAPAPLLGRSISLPVQ